MFIDGISGLATHSFFRFVLKQQQQVIFRESELNVLVTPGKKAKLFKWLRALIGILATLK